MVICKKNNKEVPRHNRGFSCSICKYRRAWLHRIEVEERKIREYDLMMKQREMAPILEALREQEERRIEAREKQARIIRVRRENLRLKEEVGAFMVHHPELDHLSFLEQLEAKQIYDILIEEQERKIRDYEFMIQERIDAEERQIQAYQDMIRERISQQNILQERKIHDYEQMIQDREEAQARLENNKIIDYEQMISDRQERKIREALEDEKIIKVYDRANDRVVFMTAQQYEEFIIYGQRYNIYETKPGESFIGTGGESINKGMFGHDGGIIASTCTECGHIFYYTYRAPANRFRAACAQCEDWTKKYKYQDHNYVRL